MCDANLNACEAVPWTDTQHADPLSTLVMMFLHGRSRGVWYDTLRIGRAALEQLLKCERVKQHAAAAHVDVGDDAKKLEALLWWRMPPTKEALAFRVAVAPIDGMVGWGIGNFIVSELVGAMA